MTALNAPRWTLLFAFVFGLLAPGVTSAQDRPGPGEIDLRPKFERGQTIRYKLELVNSNRNDAVKRTPNPGRPASPPKQPKQPTLPLPSDNPGGGLDMGAMPERSSSRVEMGLTMRVLEVSPEREATVEMALDSMKIRTEAGDEVFEFDSSKKAGGDDDVIGMLLGPIVGSKMTMKVDRNGNVTSVTGGEALAMLGQVVSGSPGGGPGGGGAAQLFGPIFSGHPTKGTAKVGESWEHSDTLKSPLLGDFRMTTRHTLRGLQGRDAQVAINGRIEPTSEAPGQSSFQVRNSSYTGNYSWDTAKGQLARMDTSMSIRLSGRVGNEEMDTRNESSVKITRISDRP